MPRRAHLDQPAPRHDTQCIAHGEQLRQIGADKYHGFTRCRKLANETVNLGLRADVNSASRLVEQQYVGVLVQRPR